MPAYTRQRIRLQVDVTDHSGIVSVIGRSPFFWRNNDIEIDLGFFLGDALVDVSQWASLTIKFKPISNITGAPVASQTITAFNTALTLDNWASGLAQHAAVLFSQSDTGLAAGDYHLVISALTLDTPAHEITLGTATITCYEDGRIGTSAPPVPADQYYTRIEGDGRYATTAALSAHTANTSNPHSTTKAQVGLGNVDNTADIAKPVSSAQAAAIAAAVSDKVTTTQLATKADASATTAALALKADLVNPSFSSSITVPTTAFPDDPGIKFGTLGTKFLRCDGADYTLGGGGRLQVNGSWVVTEATITKTMIGLGSVNNTADSAKPVSGPQQTALNLKANAAIPTFYGQVTFGGGRPLVYEPSLGSMRIKGNAGGWAIAYGFLGSAGTDYEGFGAFGSADALNYYYIGRYGYESFKVYSSGNVTIGTIGDNGYKLDVDGMLRAKSSSNADALTVANTAYTPVLKIDRPQAVSAAGTVIGQIVFRGQNFAATAMDVGAISVLAENFSSDMTSAMTFGARKSGVGIVEAMRIASTGNVLIGTVTDSGYKLDVGGTLRAYNQTLLTGGIDNGAYGDMITFAGVGFPTTYLHKIKTVHSSVLAWSKMAFSLDTGASTSVDVLTLKGDGTATFIGPVTATSFTGSNINLVQSSSTSVYKFDLIASSLASNLLFRVGVAAVSNGFTISQDASLNMRYGVDMGSGGSIVMVGGNLGVGTTSPDKLVEFLSSTQAQLRLSYSDSVKFSDLLVDSTGLLNISSPVTVATSFKVLGTPSGSGITDITNTGTVNTGGFRACWSSGYGASFECFDGTNLKWGIFKWSGTTPAVVMQGNSATVDVNFSGTVFASGFSGPLTGLASTSTGARYLAVPDALTSTFGGVVPALSRSTSPLPSAYNQGISAEFKYTANINIPVADTGRGSATYPIYIERGGYGGLITIAPYLGTVASGGGPNYQLGFFNVAPNSPFPRLMIRGGIDSTWTAWNEIQQQIGTPDVTPTLTFVGDSMSTQMGHMAHSIDWYVNLPTYNGQTFTKTNRAVFAKFLCDMVDDAPSNVWPLYHSKGGLNIVNVWAGTNDIHPSPSGHSAKTAGQIYSDLREFCSSLRLKGFKVVVTSLPSCAFDDTKRMALNDLIQKTWHQFADSIADLGADPTLGPSGAYSNTTYFIDTVHLTNAGNVIAGDIINRAILRLFVEGGDVRTVGLRTFLGGSLAKESFLSYNLYNQPFVGWVAKDTADYTSMLYQYGGYIQFWTGAPGSAPGSIKMQIAPDGATIINNTLTVTDGGVTHWREGTFTIYASNLTQGIGFGYAGISKIGTDASGPLDINAKGTGTLNLQNVATGAVNIGGALNVTGIISGPGTGLTGTAAGLTAGAAANAATVGGYSVGQNLLTSSNVQFNGVTASGAGGIVISRTGYNDGTLWLGNTGNNYLQYDGASGNNYYRLGGTVLGLQINGAYALTTASFTASGVGTNGTAATVARGDHTHSGSSYLSASATVSPGTVAINTFYTVSIPVIGAALGDPCVANHTGFTASRVWMFNAQVTSAGYVTVTYWLGDPANGSGTLSGTMYVKVLK